jgi:hypothetical protein
MTTTELTKLLEDWAVTTTFETKSFSSNLLNEINERHFHHSFSSWLLSSLKIPIRTALGEPDKWVCYPEWPTSKMGNEGPKDIYYSEEETKYIASYQKTRGGVPVGHVDFTIGLNTPIYSPSIAIEFKFGAPVPKELAFDYIKLLDPRTNYDVGISVAVFAKNKTSQEINPICRGERPETKFLHFFERGLKSGSELKLEKMNKSRYFVLVLIEAPRDGSKWRLWKISKSIEILKNGLFPYQDIFGEVQVDKWHKM